MNPLSLLNKIGVEVKFKPDDSFIARSKNVNKDSYIIEISSIILSRLKQKELIKKALLAHEIGHIKYNTFIPEMKEKSEFFLWIYNVLEDVRVEFHFIQDFPLLAKYFTLAINLLKSDVFSSLFKPI